MQKMEGGKAGSFNDANDVSVDRQGEKSRIERTHFVHTFFILNQEQCIFFFLANVRTPVLETETTRKYFKLILSIGDPSPQVL